MMTTEQGKLLVGLEGVRDQIEKSHFLSRVQGEVACAKGRDAVSEIPVIEAEAVKLPTEQAWFIPLMQIGNCGSYWITGMLAETEADAAKQIQYSSMDLKQGRIVRVVLPCKVVP